MEINILTNSSFNTTPEGVAAEKLRDMLSASIPDGIEGEINIASNVKYLFEFLWLLNIDIAVWGEFTNCVLPNYYSSDIGKEPKKDLQVKDFFVAMDLKSHQADRVFCKDSHIFVKYSSHTEDVTDYINLQRKHLETILKSEHTSVIASDAIWLNSVSKEELSTKTLDQNVNALPNEFEFKDLIDVIISHGTKPQYDKDNDCYILSAGISTDEFVSEMCILLQGMYVDDEGCFDNEDDASFEEYEKQRYAEAEAKAKDYFYNKKVRVARYCSDGYLDGFPDYQHSAFIYISDNNIDRIKKIVLADVKTNEGLDTGITFEDVQKTVSFDKIYRRNEELRSLLDIDESVDFYDSDGHVVMTEDYIPSVIGFDYPMYSYWFSYVAYNKDNTFVATPEIFDVMLTDEEYITLLTQLLLSYPDDYTFNQLLTSHPDLAAKISRPVMCEMPYIILLDEVKEDALAIVSSSEFKESDSFTAQNVDSSDLPF